MARKTEELEIDGLQVKCTQLEFEKHDQLWHDILCLVTPAVGELKGLSLDMDMTKLGPALGVFLNSLPGKQAAFFKRRLLEGTVVLHEMPDGEKWLRANEPASASLVFAGRLPTYYKVLWFSFKTNFEDFYLGDTAPFAQLLRAGAELAQPSNTPTSADSTIEPGTSGEED